MRTLALLVLALCWSLAAEAHKPSDSYLQVETKDRHVSGQWDIALRDLDFVLGLDADDDGLLRWSEVRARHADIAAYALARLTLSSGGQACELRADDQLIDHHSDGTYHVLRFHADCAVTVQDLHIDYRLLFDVDPQHKGLVRVRHASGTETAVLSADAPARRLVLGAAGNWRVVSDYLASGVWHIWIGFDHILFLIALLVPAVLHRRQGRWRSVTHFRPALNDTVKILTAFTVAHSITLGLAALGWITLPTRWVETCIAVSVILAAANNIYPILPARRWVVAFVFGLIHGFGFATVLTEFGLPTDLLSLALVGFNLGVEFGQLLIVMLFLPLAFALRDSNFYQRGIRIAGSAAVAGLAGIWMVERLFNLNLLAL